MDLFYYLLPLALWVLFFAYWGFSARRVKQTEQAEPNASRTIHLGLWISAFALIFLPDIPFLESRFLPTGNAIYFLGILLLACGLAFAIWARRHLGANWSGTITLKSDQQLIQSGPYAFARHPIYMGIILGFLATPSRWDKCAAWSRSR